MLLQPASLCPVQAPFGITAVIGVSKHSDHYLQICACLAFHGALCFVQSAAHTLYSPVATEVGGMQDGLDSQAEEQRQKQFRANRRLEKLQRDLRYTLQLRSFTWCLDCSAVMSCRCVQMFDLQVPAVATFLLLLLCHLSTPDGWYAAIHYVSVAACISVQLSSTAGCYTYASWPK